LAENLWETNKSFFEDVKKKVDTQQTREILEKGKNIATDIVKDYTAQGQKLLAQWDKDGNIEEIQSKLEKLYQEKKKQVSEMYSGMDTKKLEDIKKKLLTAYKEIKAKI